ncbi:glycosyltransferase family 4 protein [Pseudomonadota bacterium]
MKKQFPRVLLVCLAPPTLLSGGGVTPWNLFLEWPRESIAQVYTQWPEAHDKSLDIQCFFLPSKIFTWSFGSIVKNSIRFLTKKSAAYGYFFKGKKLIDWCRKFEPDIIYAIAYDDPLILRLPRVIASELDVPYVTQIWDDWPASFMENKSISEKFSSTIKSTFLKKLLTEAQANFCVSDEMCMAYKERYGLTFQSFHNCVDSDVWYRKSEKDSADELILRYVGVVTENKEMHSLTDVRNAVLNLRKKGFRIRFEINSAKIYQNVIEKNLTCPPGVIYDGSPSRAELPDKLASSDILLLAINFDEESLSYSRYSFQTKVPEYMASGTPVFAYGPLENPSIKYAHKDGWAKVVTRRNNIELERALTELVEDDELRAALSDRARNLAKRDHEGTVVRARFRAAIEAALDYEAKSGSKN